MRKLLKFLTNRFVIVSVLILVQIGVLLLSVFELSKHYAIIAAFFWVLSLVLTLVLINKNSNPSSKIPWIVIIGLVPLFGVMLYAMFSSSKLRKHEQQRLAKAIHDKNQFFAKEANSLLFLAQQDSHAASQSHYISQATGLPLYREEELKYFESGEAFFECLIEELEKARRYIYLEYFIIQPGIFWQSILDILKEKIACGVDVRLIYDDVGSVRTVPFGYNLEMEKLGIKTVVFNPYRPAPRTILHNRDHKKICIIDGATAFTGGINIADEYINRINRFGHWKDTGVMIKGDAALTFAFMFANTWCIYRDFEKTYESLRPEFAENTEKSPAALLQSAVPNTAPQTEKTDGAKHSKYKKGFLQPYSDSPLDNELTGEQVYLNIINQSTRYLYITTPYLIVDHEIILALQLAAKRDVDVRIITPYIPDKWIIHELTRSYYKELIENGVQVFEYTPGFMHAKMFLCDDIIATVGTVNLDYRSLYHHFECGVWMYNTEIIPQIKADIHESFALSKEITEEYLAQTSLPRRFIRSIFKIFAPLM